MSQDLITPYLPVFASSTDGSLSADLLNGSVSAILGGSNPALQPEEAWPRCGTCEMHLVPYIQINVNSPHTPDAFRQAVAAPSTPGRVAILQVFVCAEDENAVCFEENVYSNNPDGAAWLVRLIHLEPTNVNVAAVGDALGEMGPERFFVAERTITTWTAGNPEIEHEAINFDIDPESEFYQQHKPIESLKLLGWPVRGKYHTSIEECPVGQALGTEDRCFFRCLLQLGTHASYNDETGDTPETPLWTIGNTYIDQCTRHPEVLAMAVAGDW